MFKHDARNIIILDFISSNDMGELHFIDRIMDAKACIKILSGETCYCHSSTFKELSLNITMSQNTVKK